MPSKRKRDPNLSSAQLSKPFKDDLKKEIRPGESLEKMLKRKLRLP